ncbi:antitoxin Xre/MbcA/ParS toxin-binding domain-containing protein [Dyadobacter sp. CY326]|uniref:type II RES/Xre toxin-antitoxin system antitoxin n=1 Tax=Dyadobacter sp. CY326 TaxID=2907300 RepID=UPI001F42FA9D|nr:antitoxin Xre/MbcA/ParS toxin-binding domain-containing protein [Dyadobacter sp. CY326]MCE7066446.1 MbcA/ParS/Xre antitoxin family protein [Dyadobacter sp. CY326]
MMEQGKKMYEAVDESEPKILEEAQAAYGHSVMPASIIFSSPVRKPESKMTAIEKMRVVKQGISKTDLEGFKDKIGMDYDQLAATLSVARATLINKKGADKFNPTVSEKLVGLADIYSYGYEVFEDVDRFNRWIFSPNRALGGESPYNLLDNQYGREEVKNLIGRIDYGVYS